MAAAALITRRSILKTATGIALAAPMLSVAEAAEANHPDYALLKLADHLDAAQANLDRVSVETMGAPFGSPDASRYDQAYEACGRLVGEIEAMRANTLDGLRVKARAIDWCHAAAGEGICLNEQLTQDVRLAHQIIAALLQA